MLATLEAKKLIDGEHFSEVQQVYTSNLPQEVVDNVGDTLILITDVNTSLDLTGNNSFYATNRQVEIQIFYKLDIDFDIEQFELRLLKLFKDNHWSIADIREHTVDPDTKQMTAIFYVTQNKILN
ncbi:DUF806 family protein [Streptococcus anginosus]|uniref:DUF806 family protein n=1 Tax=Streptococcus anginosus TaxID=1328 RepID=UPI0023A9F273|nr:DUF806 family protein [Streptococcus anginosus]WEB03908.1 DUF806 family protein [Streptococcus anginosus]